MERTPLLELLDAATSRLAATAEELDAKAVAAPSLLPRWRRAHVLSHLARNADGLRSLLLAARSGAELRMYASMALRDADIEAGAGRPAEVVVADLHEAGRRFLAEAGAMPARAWSRKVARSTGQPNPPSFPAERCLGLRLVEVEVHHVDLGAGYSFADTPVALQDWLLEDCARRSGVTLLGAQNGTVSLRADAATGAPRCSGSREALLGWLTGRSGGKGVSCETGALPKLPGLP